MRGTERLVNTYARRPRYPDPEERTWPITLGICVALVLIIGGIVALVMWVYDPPKPITEGIVVEKTYDDPDHWTTGGYSKLSCSGNPVVCTSTWVPEEDHYDGPHWLIRVDGTREDGKRGDDWVELTEIQYDICGLGSTWQRANGCLSGQR